MTLIAIPEILEKKLTHEGAEALVTIFNTFEIRAKNDILFESESRFEKRLIEIKNELKTEIAEIKNELKTEIAEVKNELKTEITQSKAHIDDKIANSKSDLIKWVVGTAIGQIAILLSILSLTK